jgi:hypothetical protein
MRDPKLSMKNAFPVHQRLTGISLDEKGLSTDTVVHLGQLRAELQQKTWTAGNMDSRRHGQQTLGSSTYSKDFLHIQHKIFS